MRRLSLLLTLCLMLTGCSAAREEELTVEEAREALPEPENGTKP